MTDLVNDELFDLTVESLMSGLTVRPLTKRFVFHLLWDLPLTPPELTDFGVDIADHYRALRAVLLNGDPETETPDPDEDNCELRKRIVELDQALGNGPKLTALVKKYAPEYSGVAFKTTWDVLAEGFIELEQGGPGR